MMRTEPIVSKKFDVEDIRKIRRYNFLRHIKIMLEENIAETKRSGKNHGIISERTACLISHNVCNEIYVYMILKGCELNI